MARFLLSILLSAVLLSCNQQECVSTSFSASCCFSPDQPCTRKIVDEIGSAKREINVAMFTFTSRKIARALVKAKERGVKIRVIVDEGTSKARFCVVPLLLSRGIDVRVKRGSGGGLMHNKFAVIDGSTVLTGSFNWTVSAQRRNDENLLIIRDKKLAQAYRNRFERLWELAGMEE